MLTIQPDLTTTTTSYQGTLRSRHDTAGKFAMTNGTLLDALPNGSHTLHNGKLSSDPSEFVSRLSTQSYFKTLPRDVASASYGTFNFLGGRLTIPNTGELVRNAGRMLVGVRVGGLGAPVLVLKSCQSRFSSVCDVFLQRPGPM